MHFFLYVYVSHYSLQDHRHHAHWLPLSPLHPALCNTRISLPQHSSPSTCSHFKTQQRQMPAIRKKRVLWCNCLSTLLGNISFRQLIKYIPGPIQHPVTREITAMANKGKRPQVTGSRRKKAGFEGKQLPRAPAAQQQPPAPSPSGASCKRFGNPEKSQDTGREVQAFSPPTLLSFHLFVLYSNASICTGSDTP